MIWKITRLSIATVFILYLSKNVLNGVLKDYIYYDLETNYLHWSSKLPAISVCLRFNHNRNSFDNDSRNFLRNLLNPSKLHCRNCDRGRKLIQEMNTSVPNLVEQLITPCETLLTNCMWNDKRFRCCSRFRKLVTRRGICYSANSELIGGTEVFEVSFFAKEADIKFEVTEPVKVYMHEVRDVSPRGGFLLNLGQKLNVLFKSRETIAELETKSIDFELRNCVVQGERWKGVYSRSICKNRCQAKAQTLVCNCSHHLLRQDLSQACDLDGLQCLDDNSRKIKSEMSSFCDCGEACDEIMPKIISKKLSRYKGHNGKANFVLSFPPTERLIMKSKTNNLERLVALACISRWLTNLSLMDLFRLFMDNLFKRKERSFEDKSILY
ncbi:uncharacterized protein LOC106666496 [Cimex lectularius]|uniref:Uncharacterized protein n=1 Tax=Cimex lectularius TaxID=79782 RepID=A0A8I6RMF6_CIMLE|nr:uncharacterized protein LOC106666496 [Cimex lectularius]